MPNLRPYFSHSGAICAAISPDLTSLMKRAQSVSQSSDMMVGIATHVVLPPPDAAKVMEEPPNRGSKIGLPLKVRPS